LRRILFVIGTRPEIIKTAPVVLEFKKDRRYKVAVCFTGQHQSMALKIADEFALRLDFDLKLMQPQQTLNSIVSAAILKLNQVYEDFKPNLVFVQGDTTTAFCAALAAFQLKINVAHIEAGLRTFDKNKPFPEEINRAMITRIADLHFAPTPGSKNNLIRERIPKNKIIVTGNTAIDALLYIKHRKKAFLNKDLMGLAKDKKIILVTAHRRESFGKPLRDICNALKIIARNNDLIIIYPVHLNPNVLRPVKRILGEAKNILLIEPLEYSDFVSLMDASFCILTDSGGVQEEAPSLGKPVLILRDKTERPEVVSAGCARIVGTNSDAIVKACQELLTSKRLYRVMSKNRNPVGDGRAAYRIKKKIDSYL
jgi:UDP-N-acetylglucosamine 2-epimerase (non-hydrolysing)